VTSAIIEALSDAHADGAIDLTALRAKCLAAISAGDGHVAFTVGATLNGKGANQECRMDAAELLAAVNQALRLARGDAVSLTYCDFSQLR
jgi:hypothetical protein